MSRLRPLLIIVVGLVLGIGLGLYLGWEAWPTEFTDANPSVLQETYRQDYVRLIATASPWIQSCKAEMMPKFANWCGWPPI